MFAYSLEINFENRKNIEFILFERSQSLHLQMVTKIIYIEETNPRGKDVKKEKKT